MSRLKENFIKHKRFDQHTLNATFIKTYSQLQRKTNKKIALITDANIHQNRCLQVKNINEIENIKEYDYVVYFDHDNESYKNIKIIIDNKCRFMSLLLYYPTVEYYQRDKIIQKVLTESHKQEARKYNLADYQNIIQAIDITKNLSGCYLEIGVMYGPSANVAINYMKEMNIKRESYFLDTYEGFKYDVANLSSDALWGNTHFIADSKDHMKMIQDLLGKDANVIKNNIITEELPDQIVDVVVCNLDVDMYEAVRYGLFKVAPLIVKSGIIICEDAGHTPALIGAYCALKEFLESDLGKGFIPIQMESGQTFLIKK